jgi:HSP20 family protein
MHYQRFRHRFAAELSASHPRPPELARAQWLSLQLAQPHWRPPADVYESTSAVVIIVELAGIDERALTVMLFEDAVVIDGQRRIPPGDSLGVYHTAEIRQGPFRLELAFPALVDADRVDAHSDQGLLRIILAKPARGSAEGQRA